MITFIFNDQAEVGAVHRAELPPNIKTEGALLDALSVELRFPDYFGRNWNALDECIRDLSWLPPGDVALIHKDLPLADSGASLSIYLCILHDALQNWKTTGSNLIFASPEKRDTSGDRDLLVRRRLLVTFPLETKDTVERVLAEAHKNEPARRQEGVGEARLNPGMKVPNADRVAFSPAEFAALFGNEYTTSDLKANTLAGIPAFTGNLTTSTKHCPPWPQADLAAWHGFEP